MTLLGVAALSAVLFSSFVPTAIAQDSAVQRIALVIGISDYFGSDGLANPANDARLMAATLRELDFDVELIEDADLIGLNAGLDHFAARLRSSKGALGLFYYAGHAVQQRGRNFLLPTDFRSNLDGGLAAGSLPADKVLQTAAASLADIVVLILDACRNSPIDRQYLGVAPGLAPMERSTIESVVAYATAAGDVAADGTGSNSPFTIALARALSIPNADLFEQFRMVRRDVKHATNNLQLPWISASLESEVILKPDGPPKDLATANRPLAAVHWQTIANSRDVADFEQFISWFPDDPHVKQARVIKDQLALQLTIPAITVRPDPKDASTGGWLRTERTTCDILASDPLDPQRITTGVRSGVVNTRLALRACMQAVVDDRSEPRHLFHLARSLDVAARFEEAAVVYKIAEPLGYLSAMVNRAYLLLNGLGSPVRPSQAAALYAKAAKLGHPRGRAITGLLLTRGEGVDKNVAEGIRWLELAASTGWPQAHNILGDIFRKGQLVDTDYTRAKSHYEQAASANYASAFSNLGRMAQLGLGQAVDVGQAAELYQKATELGEVWAPWRLASMMLDNGTNVDAMHAVDLLELAAERGATQAWLDLAKIFEQGILLPADSKRADDYRRRAE